MNELISKLIAIKETAKGIHYTCIGDNAFAVHLLADRVADEIDGFIDSCKESILGADTYPLSSKKYLTMAIDLIPDINAGKTKENLFKLYNLIDNTLQYINSMEIDKADENLVGNIAEKLKNNKGLINLQIS